jgi:hypothetical protein
MRLPGLPRQPGCWPRPGNQAGELSGPMLAGWFRSRYTAAAPATWNRELATLRAAVGWWRRCGWLTVDPTDGLERRRSGSDRTRASPVVSWSGCLAATGRPSCSPAYWPAGPTDRSSQGDRRPTRAVAGLDLDRPAGGPGCRTGGRTVSRAHRVDAAAAAPFGPHPRRRGRHQLPLLLARSRHPSVRSLERYARPGPEAVARHLADTDPARRRP